MGAFVKKTLFALPGVLSCAGLLMGGGRPGPGGRRGRPRQPACRCRGESPRRQVEVPWAGDVPLRRQPMHHRHV